jgi:heme exporter protein A
MSAASAAADAATGQVVLAARAISKSFVRTWAVRRVTLELTPGTVVALTGDNGAGKSTLLRILAGLVKPDEGTVEVCGERFSGFLPADVRARMGFIGHLPFVYGDLSGIENVRFFKTLYETVGETSSGTGWETRLLARVGLGDAGDKIVRTYSRGMTQRLALARLMLQNPAIWLLDEPSTGLDAQGYVLLRAILDEARARGRCVLAVTHDLSALGPIDREVRLFGGRVAA